MSVMDVRVVVDQVRITDPNDPALDHNSLNLVVRASFGDQVIAERVVDAEVPEFGPRGTVVSLNKVLPS